MHESIRRREGHWESFDDIDGLCHECWCLLEDVAGNIWIGTRSGLSRYDGRGFANLSDVDGLADNNVQCLQQDSKGRLWIGTRNGLSRYDGAEFVTFTQRDGLAGDYVQCLHLDQQGHLWIGTRSGLSRYDGQTFTNISDEDGLASNNIQYIYQDRDGNIWIGTSRGLSRHNDGEIVSFTTKDGLPDGYVYCIHQDEAGNIWIGTNSGLSRYDGAEFVTFTQQDGLPLNQIQRVFQDIEGNIWIGTLGGGASCYDGKEFVTFNTEHGLAHNNVYDLIQDREGSIWFACHHGGISRYNPHGISYISDESVSEVIVRDSTGNLWWGSENLLSRFDGENTDHYLLDNGVYELFEDSRGHFWIGTDYGGVFKYDTARDVGSQVPQNLTASDGLVSDWAIRIYEDAGGNIWIGSSGGVCRYDGEKFVKFGTGDGLGSSLISTIFQDSSGVLWFGGWEGGGITSYDGNTFRIYTKADGLVSDGVVCMMEDDKKSLWIGTSAGISCYDGKAFRNYTIADGLSGNFVQRITQDSSGQIWIATLGAGVSRFDGRNFQMLTTENGLPSNNVTGIIEDSDGGMIISTYKGICKYALSRKTPPLIRIDEVDTGRIYKEPQVVEFSEKTSSLRVRYHGVSFKTKRMGYNYILEGYDEDWKITRDDEARYEDLPVGEYTFKVVAIDKDLVHSEEPALLSVKVTADTRDQVISELEEKVRERTAELRAANDYTNNVVRSMLDTLIVVDQHLIIMTVNRATLDLLGYEENELIGKPIEMILETDELLEPPDPENLIGINSVLDIERGFIRNIENTYVSKDGRKIPVLFSGSIMHDNDGEIQGIVCVAANITERKQAEERDRRQSEFLRSVLESLTHPFYVIDVHDYTVTMSNSAADLEGLSVGSTCYDTTDKDSKPCHVMRADCPVRQIAETGEPVIVEHIHYDRNGEPKNVEVHGYPIFDHAGNVVQIIEYCLDITERKRAEEELRKHRAHLEELVQDRTEELTRTIQQLENEMAERVQAQEEIRSLAKFPGENQILSCVSRKMGRLSMPTRAVSHF